LITSGHITKSTRMSVVSTLFLAACTAKLSRRF
jgi:hypothetical protein